MTTTDGVLTGRPSSRHDDTDGRPRPRRRWRARAAPVPEGARRCLVLACTPEDVIAADLATGAVVRLRSEPAPEPGHASAEPGAPSTPTLGDLAPFDVIDATWTAGTDPDDLAHPEAVAVDGVPSVVGTLRGRRARRLLRALVVPGQAHLLGFPGSSAPYWEFRGMRPSVAVVVPSRGPLLFLRRRDDTVWSRFGWPRSDNWLPVEDRRAVLALHHARRDRLAGKDLAHALGFRPSFLVVALSRPREGHCYKTVAAILPRP